MAQVSGKYDHPAYLAVQFISLKPTVGAGTSGYKSFPNALHLRALNATVQVAGTGTGAQYVYLNGTTPLGTTAFSTNAKGAVVAITDLNAIIPANAVLSIVTVDATVVADVSIETHIDPSGTWTGPAY
jgi:hypothetical protein